MAPRQEYLREVQRMGATHLNSEKRKLSAPEARRERLFYEAWDLLEGRGGLIDVRALGNFPGGADRFNGLSFSFPEKNAGLAVARFKEGFTFTHIRPSAILLGVATEVVTRQKKAEPYQVQYIFENTQYGMFLWIANSTNYAWRRIDGDKDERRHLKVTRGILTSLTKQINVR